MFSTRITHTDPRRLTELDLAPDPMLVDRITRANSILESELAKVTKETDIVAEWQIYREPIDLSVAELKFVIGREILIGGRFTREDFTNDETIRRSLRIPLMALGRFLGEYFLERLERARERLQEDLKTLTTVSED